MPLNPYKKQEYNFITLAIFFGKFHDVYAYNLVILDKKAESFIILKQQKTINWTEMITWFNDIETLLPEIEFYNVGEVEIKGYVLSKLKPSILHKLNQTTNENL